MKKTVLSLAAALLICCCLPAASGSNCTFVVVVKTGSMAGAGTDARVSVRFQGPGGHGLLDIPDLEAFPHQKADPFERGSVDTFIGINGTCFTYPCKMRLQSDGTGPYPGWYVESVFLLAIAESLKDEASHLFRVDQWLAVDEPPHQLFAERDDCDATTTATGAGAGRVVGAAVM
jgi:hypothetical protein